MSGTLGSFQANTEEGQQVSTGWLHAEDGWLTLETLIDDPFSVFSDPSRESPVSIEANTPHGQALLLENRWIGENVTIGPKASTKRHQSRTLIAPVLVEQLRSSKLFSIEAKFPGIGLWSGMKAARPQSVKDGRGLLKSFSVSVSSDSEYSYRLPHGRTLTLGTTWEVSGPDDQRTIYSPTTLICSSHRRRDVFELLAPLIAFQDMVNSAFGGFVAADAGTVQLDVEEESTKRPKLWNGALMESLPGVASPKSMTEFPLFNVNDIGGVAGIVRWYRLWNEHRRAVSPVVHQYRHGKPLAETAFMDIGSAIEYWVKSNGSRQWASKTTPKSPKNPARPPKNYALALAKWLGRPFAAWVGDTEQWAVDFHETYNAIKHEVSYVPDTEHLIDLLNSGRYLLLAALLNRAANRRTPSEAVFGSHRTANLGTRLQNRYT